MSYIKKLKTRGSLIALAVMVVFSVLLFVPKLKFRFNYKSAGELMTTIDFKGYFGLLLVLLIFTVAVAIICRIHRIQWPHIPVILIDAISIIASVIHYFSIDKMDLISLIIVGYVLLGFLGFFFCYGIYYVFKWVGNVHDYDYESPYEAQRKREPEPMSDEEFDALVARSAKNFMEIKKNSKK